MPTAPDPASTSGSAAPAQPGAVLSGVLRVLRPLVRLLLRHGVTYPALAAALKPVFLDAAQAELRERGMASTDSALTLLSGVHRRDVRALTRGKARALADAPSASVGLSAEVIGRWMADPAYAGRVLARSGPGSFDELAASVSRDVRPRAVLDELLRLGTVREGPDGLAIDAAGFAPRQGFAEMSELFAANLHDHVAAAASNLDGRSTHLEQAVFVDELSAESVERLRLAAVEAWKQAFQRVFAEAQARYDHDAAHTRLTERSQRARFGVFFYSAAQDDDRPDAARSPR